MTYKETIDWCNQFENNLVSVDIDVKRRTLALQAMKVCKEALEKQIPKKPIEDGYYDKPCVCPTCGQALDWSEE